MASSTGKGSFFLPTEKFSKADGEMDKNMAKENLNLAIKLLKESGEMDSFKMPSNSEPVILLIFMTFYPFI